MQNAPAMLAQKMMNRQAPYGPIGMVSQNMSGNKKVSNPYMSVSASVSPLAVGKYDVYVFNASGTFTVKSLGPDPTEGSKVEYLVIAGGGAGATSGSVRGPGGAGGYLSGAGFSVTAQTYAITVGAGGSSLTDPGTNGNNSSIAAAVVSSGGGGGGGTTNGGALPAQANGRNGGSGGGGSGYDGVSGAAGTGIAGQGFNGSAGNGSFWPTDYSTGGGGGAGGVAPAHNFDTGGDGGPGVSSSITGVAVLRGGGGGGAGSSGNGSASAGGGIYPGTANATANTGGGGASFGLGGSGVVIIKVRARA